MKIAVLADNLINRIAAGEVVERPASVVKELVDNSLDAGGKEISIWVEGNGTALIKVADDGGGMALEDLSVAFERHSTSKIRTEADLVEISTLGFRGEALPSIASVSTVEVWSRTVGQAHGGRLRMTNGEQDDPVTAGCPVGTTIEVRDLFLHVPARLKFLKSPRTELNHITDVVDRLALSHESVHFRLEHTGRLLADYVATPKLVDRVHQVLGEVGREMVPFDQRRGRLRCHGFSSVAPTSFGNSRYIVTFVNRRFVRDRVITHAVLKAYDTLLMKGRFPATVLYLDVPFEQVDVNVHPAKTEVRFRAQSDIYETVLLAVRSGLQAAAQGVGSAPVEHDQAGDAVAEPMTWYRGPVQPRGSLDLAFGSPRFASVEMTRGVGVSPPGEQVPRQRFSLLEVVGQVLGCYIVCQAEAGMILVDQHAAHERLAYEKLRQDMEQGEVEVQELLLPQTLELPVTEATILEAQIGALRRAGFSVEKFGRNTFSIHAVPVLLAMGDYRDAIRAMVSELAEVGHSAELQHNFQERLMTIACHSVIRANRVLRKEEMVQLLKDLDTIEFATQCPHGRPVMVEFRRSQLERMFRRA